MGVLTRFVEIINANINALLEKAEDPAKMVDQYLIDARNDLADVKKQTAEVMAEEARTKRLVDVNAADVAKYTDLAKKALDQIGTLKGCDIHCPVTQYPQDISILRKLGLNLTCEPVLQTKLMFGH